MSHVDNKVRDVQVKFEILMIQNYVRKVSAIFEIQLASSVTKLGVRQNRRVALTLPHKF